MIFTNLIVMNYITFCLCFHFSLLLFSYLNSPSIKFYDPVNTQYFGKLVYLTYQGNYLTLAYFLLAFYNVLFKNIFCSYLISYLYPLIFSLSFFITVGFYLLDYSNPIQRRKRADLSRTFPYLYITTHTDHFFIFPLVFFFGYNYPLMKIEDNFLIITYTISYIIFLFFNKYLTTGWPYPIIDDIEFKFGSYGRNIFFIFLVFFMDLIGQQYKLLL